MTRRDGLWQAKERCSECSNAIFEENWASVHCWSGAWNLDAEPILRNTELLELTSIAASMCNHFVGIICMERRGLEEDTALDIVDVLCAEENALRSLVSA